MSLTIDLASTEEEARERFERDTDEHKMTVLHDDGLYRHLRFSAKGSFDWFDLITWPGRLTIDGGHGTYTFSRQEDMLTFFRVHGRGINPHYWSEKLIGPDAGRGQAKAYSEQAYREHIKEAVDTWLESYYENEAQATSLRAAVQKDLLDTEDWDYPGGHHETARQRINAFKHRMVPVGTKYDFAAAKVLPLGYPEQEFTFTDAWEWDLSGYDLHFLWSCWAIRYGIQKYDASKPMDVFQAEAQKKEAAS